MLPSASLLLPVLVLALLVFGLAGGRTAAWGGAHGVREAVCLSAAAVAAWALGTIWVLSALRMLTREAAIGSWTLALVAALVLAGWRLKTGWRLRVRPVRPAPDEALLALLLAALLIPAGLMAAAYVPNNADSMVYHLPRQLVWISQRTVFVPWMPSAHMDRMPPFAEYLGVHLFLLAGNDRWLNFVQFAAFGVGLILLSLVVREFGGGRRAQLLAAVFFAAVPPAFLQASNTKNDLVLTAVLLGLLWLGVRVERSGQLSWAAAAAAGCLAAAALLTKGTALAYLPVATAGVLVLLFARRSPVPLGRALAAAGIALVVAAPHFAPRFGGIVRAESGRESAHVNADRGLSTAASVLVRNLAIQAALPWPGWNARIENGVATLHERLGADVNGPASTFQGTSFAVRYAPELEDLATAPWQFLFLVAAPVLALVVRWPPDRVERWVLVLLPVAALVAFSFLFRWQPWHSRLLIPCLALAALPFGLFFGSPPGRMPRAVGLACCAGLFVWLVPSFAAVHRPLPRAWEALQAGGAFLAVDEIVTHVNAAGVTALFAAWAPSSIVIDTTGGPVHPLLRVLRRADGTWPVLLAPEDPRATDAEAWLQHFVSWVPVPPVPWESGRGGHLSQVLSTDGLRIGARKRWSIAADVVPAFVFERGARGLGPVQLLDAADPGSAFRQVYFPAAIIPAPVDGQDRLLRVRLRSYAGGNRFKIVAHPHVLGEIDVPADGGEASADVVIPGHSEAPLVELRAERGHASTWDPEPVAARATRLQLLPLESR